MTKDWKLSKLGDICHKVTDGSHNPPKGIDVSEFMMLSSKNIFDDQITIEKPRYLTPSDFEAENRRTEVSPNDVLLTVVGTVGRAAIVPEDFPPITLQRSVAVLKPDMDVVNPRFMMFGLHSILDQLLAGARGVAQKGIYLRSLREVPIPISPLEEQQRIVAVLDEAFEGLARARAHAETNLENALELLAVSLDDIFGSENPSWKTAALSELCVIGDGNHSSKYPKKSEMVPEGVPFLRSGNIQNGEIDRGEMLYISESKHAELKKGHLKSGDVLFTNRGEIGKVAIVPDDLEGSNLNSQVAWLRCQGDLDNRFLFFFLQSGRMKQHYLDTQSGAALQQFTIKMLKAVTVRFPSLPEQEAAVKRMATMQDDIFRLISAYQATTIDLYDLRQSLLHKAFAGELT